MDRRGHETARVAWLYFVEEQTQGEVARELGVSRSTVVRHLRRAKEKGLVRIELDVPQDVFEMERELERLYGLEKVRLVPDAGDEEKVTRWLGHAASGLVTEMVEPGTTVAVGWGTTLREMTNALAGEQATGGVRIVPLCGGVHRASTGANSHWVAERLGRYFCAPAEALYAPLFVGDRSTAEALTRDPGVCNTLDLARGASLAVYGVGTLHEGATMNRLGYLSPEERAFLGERGAEGDIACRWIDVRGDPVELPPTINPVSVSLEELKRVPRRLAIAGGRQKREVLLGTLRGGYATALVTDDSTGAYLLERVTDRALVPGWEGRDAERVEGEVGTPGGGMREEPSIPADGGASPGGALDRRLFGRG